MCFIWDKETNRVPKKQLHDVLSVFVVTAVDALCVKIYVPFGCSY